MNVKLIGTMALAMSLAACGSNKTNQETAIDSTAVAVATPTQWFGTYEGTLPAADCEGIKTTLMLNNDSTYTLRSEYLGKEDGVFETSGVYNLKDSTLVELITPSTGEKTYYKILENDVMLSDSLGTINQGELAEHYKLHKK